MDNDKKDGADAGERARRKTPVVLPATVEDTLKRLARVRLRIGESRGMHDGTVELLDAVEKLVRQGGSDAEIRDIERRLSLHVVELSEYMRDELSSVLAGLGRALWRMSEEP